jgi:hypothetical protein
MNDEKKEPLASFTEGRALAKVWPMNGKNGPFYSVTVQRMYKKEGEESWSYTGIFGDTDLPNVSKVSCDAYNWINANPAGASEPTEDTDTDDQAAA